MRCTAPRAAMTLSMSIPSDKYYFDAFLNIPEIYLQIHRRIVRKNKATFFHKLTKLAYSLTSS